MRKNRNQLSVEELCPTLGGATGMERNRQLRMSVNDSVSLVQRQGGPELFIAWKHMHATLYLMHSVMGSQCSFCRRVAEWRWWDAMRISLKAEFWTFWRVDNRTGCIHETPLDKLFIPSPIQGLSTEHFPYTWSSSPISSQQALLPKRESILTALHCPEGRAYSLSCACGLHQSDRGAFFHSLWLFLFIQHIIDQQLHHVNSLSPQSTLQRCFFYTRWTIHIQLQHRVHWC